MRSGAAQRLRTEEELRLVQQRFSATFNQAAVGMAHTTTSGRFQLVNQRLAEMLGVPVEQLLSLSLTDFLLPSERELESAELAALVAGEQSGHRVEHELMRYDGTTFPAQLTVSMLRHDDSTAPSLLWVVEDISARKVAERETTELMTRLINSERLAAAGRMANTLAHEINNPLEALTNIVYLLQTHDLSPQARELAAVAARELERVGHITRSTLSFYRKTAGAHARSVHDARRGGAALQSRVRRNSISRFARASTMTCAMRTMTLHCARSLPTSWAMPSSRWRARAAGSASERALRVRTRCHSDLRHGTRH